jgi:hypothetical protein
MSTREQIVEANGVDLCAESFGDPSDPAVLLLQGRATPCWPGTRSSSAGRSPRPAGDPLRQQGPHRRWVLHGTEDP